LNLTGAAASNWSITSGGLTINSTSAALTLQTTTSGTIALTSAGATNITSAAASTWTHSGGGWALNSTSQPISITTSYAGAATTPLTISDTYSNTTGAGQGILITTAATGAGGTGGNLTLSTTKTSGTAGNIVLNSGGAINHTSAAASTWTHSGGAFAINSTGQNITLSTGTSGAIILNSAGSITPTSAGAVTWTHSGGAWLLQSTGQNATIQTLTSGTIALTSAGATNITSAAASTWTHSGGAWALTSTNQPVTISTMTSGAINLTAAAASNIVITTSTTGLTQVSGNFQITGGTAGVTGTFNSTTTAPLNTNVTRLNYEGSLYATQFVLASTSPSSLIAGAIYGGTTAPSSTQQININGNLYSTSLNTVNDVTINGFTVGKGAGSVASNTVFGIGALASNSTGANNTAIGSAALDAVASSAGSTAVGANALTLSTGANNTALGYNAGTAITTGTNNVVIGQGTGATNLTTGSNNIVIGSGVDLSASGNSNEIDIGNSSITSLRVAGVEIWNSTSGLIGGSSSGGLTAGATQTGFINYNGTTPSAGQWHGGSTAPLAGATTQLNYNGYLYATKVYNAVWNDLAEYMYKDPSDDACAGDVLVQTETGLVKSFKRAHKAVVGVYSDTYGYALGAEDKDNKYPIGLAGVVNVKVEELLEIGDLLVSGENGFAVRATDEEARTPGLVLGKVLENKKDTLVSRVKILILHI
jgi:hypothetical protein